MKRGLIFAVLALVGATAASAQEYRAGDIVVTEPWARATTARMPNAAAYMTVSTCGAEPDRLISLSTTVAEMAHLHTSYVESEITKMAPVEAIEIVPGEPTALEPGGLHVMLMGMKGALAVGSVFPMTLTFERAGTIEVQVTVHGPGAMQHRPGG